MIVNYPYLNDSVFLKALDLERIKTKIVKIVILTKDEIPITEVTGKVTSGSINVKGDSGIQRTANLDFVVPSEELEEQKIKQYFIINRRVSIQIGIKNTLTKEYPAYANYDYIWFPQGIFIMGAPDFSRSTEGFTISLQLEDKMSLLNGTNGGTFPASVELDTYDTIDETGAVVTKQISIYQLITELVNHWGGEQLSKIIIEDVPKTATMGLVWNYSEGSYIEDKIDGSVTISNSASNIISDYNSALLESKKNAEKITDFNNQIHKAIVDLEANKKSWSETEIYNSNVSSVGMDKTVEEAKKALEDAVSCASNETSTEDELKEKLKALNSQFENYSKLVQDEIKAKGSFNKTLYWASDSQDNGVYFLGDVCEDDANAATQITPPTNIFSPYLTGKLSLRKNELGRYKYEKGDFIGGYTDLLVYPTNSSEHFTVNAGDSVLTALSNIASKLGESNYEYFYDINGNFVFRQKKDYQLTSKATSDLNKLMNLDSDAYLSDIGKNSSTYVFDNPELFISYRNTPNWNNIKNDFVIWGTSSSSQPIRYHLAIDTIPDYKNHVYKNMIYNQQAKQMMVRTVYDSKENFPKIGEEEIIYYDKATNKYYQWDSFNNIYKDITTYTKILENGEESEPLETFILLKEITPPTWRDDLYLSGVQGTHHGGDSNDYFMELEAEWPKYFTIENGEYKSKNPDNIYNITYYLDFIDSNAEISKYSVQSIGRRTYAKSDTQINCLFEPSIPEYAIVPYTKQSNGTIKLTQEGETIYNQTKKDGQKYILLEDILYDKVYQSGAIYNSAFYAVRDILKESTSLQESISLDCIPIYYLQPNTRISVYDKKTDISGDYLIDSFTIPLDVGSTMSIECNRVIDSF